MGMCVYVHFCVCVLVHICNVCVSLWSVYNMHYMIHDMHYTGNFYFNEN